MSGEATDVQADDAACPKCGGQTTGEHCRPNPDNEAYWNDPANRHWVRHSSVYDDRKGGC